MDGQGHGSPVTPGFESDAQHVSRRFIGLVKAREVRLAGSAAGFVAAGANLSVLNGGCGPVLTRGSVTIRDGGLRPP
jgi:hypothetical protein